MTDITAERARELLDRIARIEADIEDFDGDRRGHYCALSDAEEALRQVAPDLARTVIAQDAEIASLRAKLEKAVGASRPFAQEHAWGPDTRFEIVVAGQHYRGRSGPRPRHPFGDQQMTDAQVRFWRLINSLTPEVIAAIRKGDTHD